MIEIAFDTYFKLKQPLLEGGNVRVIDSSGHEVQAEKIDLQKHSRTDLAKKLLLFFHKLNSLYEKKTGTKIWENPDSLTSGHVFNGSSEHFFNSKIDDKEFVKYKKTVGDIDLTVPSDKKFQLFDFLSSIAGNKITENTTFIGTKQTSLTKGHQLNSLVQIDNKLNVQIDFEFLEYHDKAPTRFAKFSHSSSWEDVKEGFKGVLHKYLLQSVAGSSDIKTSEQVALFTKTATKEKPKLVKTFPAKGLSFKKFSIDRGLRTDAFQRYHDEQGNAVDFEGKPVYKEKSTEESTYITEPELIGKEIFGTKFSSTDLSNLNSFVGLIELCMKFLVPNVRLNVFTDFARRLFGVGAQGFERNNPALDYDIKKAGFQKIKQRFKITSVPDLPNTYSELMSLSEDASNHKMLLEIKKYYENYRMTSELD